MLCLEPLTPRKNPVGGVTVVIALMHYKPDMSLHNHIYIYVYICTYVPIGNSN